MRVRESVCDSCGSSAFGATAARSKWKEEEEEEGAAAVQGQAAVAMPRKPVREDDDAVAASKEAPKNVRPCLPACVCAVGEERERRKRHTCTQ